jgi:hypothetical protein
VIINMYVMLMLMLWDVNACLTPRGVTRLPPENAIGAGFASSSNEEEAIPCD